jgi:opacity protein-like surface antigen
MKSSVGRKNMKKHHSVALAGVCAGAFCLTTHAQTPIINGKPTPTMTPASPTYYSYTPRAYIGADLGGVITSDPTVKEFFGPVSPGTKVSLNPGVRFDFVGGYQFTDWLSVEGETGIMANTIDSIPGANIDGYAALDNVPLLVNLRLQLPPNKCHITPYIGGGVGGSVSIIDFEDNIDFNGVSGHGSDASVQFAYQAFAGLRYAISDNLGIGVAYHYFVTDGADWKFDNTFGTATDHIKFSGTRSHAITLAFDYHF